MDNNKYNEYINYFRKALSIGQSFDVKERNLVIGGRETCMYYAEGFMKSEIMEQIFHVFFEIQDRDMEHCSNTTDFIKKHVPYAQAAPETNMDKLVKAILTGLTVIVIDGFSEAIVLDLRTYPVRSVAEPDKEKSLRGPKDGLVETLLFNVNMIRRRIRDPKLIFELHTVGKLSKTDVIIGFMKGAVDEKTLNNIRDRINGIMVDTVTVGEQSIVEAIGKSKWMNPFPKVRYTQRPDVVAAHLAEGKLVIMVDNSPTALLIPTCIFDFLQDSDDYYFPILTGNYFRLVRFLNMIAVIFLTPVYLLIAEGNIPVPQRLDFFIPDEGYAIPLFFQFILLEFAIDALKLASLNTPSSLGMSLSVIGALILGQFSIDAGWFIPQSILCMAVLALAAFTQPSIELGYAIKFMRVLILVGAGIAGVWGALIALALNIIVLATTKNIVGTSYLYPLIPFHWATLRKLIFRTRKPDDQRK